MKKIPNLFVRDFSTGKITRDKNPAAAWVFNGEGVAKRKHDGTCCRVYNGTLWRRREVKKGKPIPEGFEPAGADNVTGKTVGWIPVTDGNNDIYHREAFRGQPDGTYELCGPKIQKNPEGFLEHTLVSHSAATEYPECPRSFEGLAGWLSTKDIEGVVFHHPDGRMAKIRKGDFGQDRICTS